MGLDSIALTNRCAGSLYLQRAWPTNSSTFGAAAPTIPRQVVNRCVESVLRNPIPELDSFRGTGRAPRSKTVLVGLKKSSLKFLR